jgi:hypothetical protein
MITPQKSGAKARLKLVSVGNERVLLLRFVGRTEYAAKVFPARIREHAGPERASFDGEVWRIRGDQEIKWAAGCAVEQCRAVYDPNLLQLELSALPNPWSIPEEPLRDPKQKPVLYMARVFHPDLAESLAFQLPLYDDDFLIEFSRRLSHAKAWCRYRSDLKIWAVADYYTPIAHDVLDAFYEMSLGSTLWRR